MCCSFCLSSHPQTSLLLAVAGIKYFIHPFTRKQEVNICKSCECPTTPLACTCCYLCWIHSSHPSQRNFVFYYHWPTNPRTPVMDPPTADLSSFFFVLMSHFRAVETRLLSQSSELQKTLQMEAATTAASITLVSLLKAKGWWSSFAHKFFPQPEPKKPKGAL